MIFTEFGHPFVLKSDNGPCCMFHEFIEFYKVHHFTSSPHYPQSNGFAEALVGISKKLMEKSIKDGKPWNYGLLKYRVTPIGGNLPSPLEALTGCRPRTSLPQIPSSIGKSVETSVVGQPAKEPESYWVKFPDNSILGRTRSMIKSQAQPFYFELEVKGKDWNSRGHIPPHSHHPFNSNLPALEISALPMDPSVLPTLTSNATLYKDIFLSVLLVRQNLPLQAVIQ